MPVGDAWQQRFHACRATRLLQRGFSWSEVCCSARIRLPPAALGFPSVPLAAQRATCVRPDAPWLGKPKTFLGFLIRERSKLRVPTAIVKIAAGARSRRPPA